jgi:hypothetical protein
MVLQKLVAMYCLLLRRKALTLAVWMNVVGEHMDLVKNIRL